MTPTWDTGVRLAGIGTAVPSRVLTNHDLEKIMDTTNEWILQRTGIHQRYILNSSDESEFSLAVNSLQRALDSASMPGSELDLIIHGSVTSEMSCPSNACRIAREVGALNAGAFDLVAACSGFLYGLNLADTLIRSGRARNVGVIGCDALSTITDYNERSVSILFGDGGGAAVVTPDPDPERGCIFQTMAADPARWETLYLPRRERDVREWDRDNPIRLGALRMQGREVFKFAVTKFRETIEEALAATGLGIDDVAQFVCHQSNERIIQAAKEKLGLPDEKVLINIDRYGNTSAASIGLVLDELNRAGRINPGDILVMVAFGGGLTWASTVWRY
jgi:3-oxoacyl-[acyl-carrier-protein] synthase-3